MSHNPLIFIIAGEPSGDRIGGEIIKALKTKSGGKLRFAGVGGKYMHEQGLTSIFPMSDLTLMGAIEILPKLLKVYKRYCETLDAIRTVKPDLVLTVDSPDFCLRIAKKAKSYGFPVIHYTAPTVWAWRPGRAAAMAKYLDHLLLLYRFEKKYFDAVDLPNTFVGHPLCTSGIDEQNPADFRKKYNLSATAPLLCILPGSRRAEVVSLMPVFHEALKKILKNHPKIKFVLPVAPQAKDIVEGALRTWDIPVTLVEGEDDKYGAMKASKAALAASGTVTLELAMAQLPTLITYIMNPITVWLGKKFIKTKYIGLPNIILNKLIMPELLQENCTPENIVTKLEKLLNDEQTRERQVENFKLLRTQLMLEGETPSEKAAQVILDVIDSQTEQEN